MSLTPKQNAFVAPPGFYVYALIDPRDGIAFYVGKGSGRRALAHDGEARNGRTTNPRKTARILEIMDAGLRHEIQIVKAGLNESEALELERKTIQAAGAGNLTNHAPGVYTKREWARMRLARIIPFDVWIAERSRSEVEIALFHEVVKQLSLIAAGSLDNLPRGVSFA